jgi:simple sugar transport system ATP-binding protein
VSASGALLRLQGIGKRFVGVQALADVDFELAAGEVHALLGENGAGKSTLIKLLTGAHALDSGRMFLGDREIRPASPAAAQRLGISCVYQEVNLLPNLRVSHNLFLGRDPRRLGRIRWAVIHAAAEKILQGYGLAIDVRRSLASFPIAVQQLVAIARGVEGSARVLVLDEPTASLDAHEVELLFRIIMQLRAAGLGIIFITHFLDQVYAISDRISVLRNGRRVGTFAAQDLPRPALIAHMLGKELQSVEQESAAAPAAAATPPVIELNRLAAANGLRAVSFTARTGEAVGLAGLLGSGRSEVCEVLFGLAGVTAGQLRIYGRDARFAAPAQAIRAGLALCPEDRRAAGILGLLGVRENIVLGLQARRGWWRRIGAREQQRIVAAAIKALCIVCADTEAGAATLSGGNQQKLILARWLAIEPRILILDEPTRGIDIGAHAEIIRLIRRLRDNGMSVLIASSELDELIAFSDRVVVMRERTTAAELSGNAITEPAILAAIAASAPASASTPASAPA